METIQPSRQWEDKTYPKAQFGMVDVGAKPVTHRRAIAQGKIRLSKEAFIALRTGNNPKGNVLALAEVAGILAAKKTADWIPLCHPLPLDRVQFSFHLEESTFSVMVYCEVSANAKTGVEMEALTGIQAALLSIYDLSKAVNPVLTLSDIRLNLKEGGKSGKWIHPDFAAEEKDQDKNPVELPLLGIRASIFTISDRAAAGKLKDESGQAIRLFLSSLGSEVVSQAIIPDEKDQIQKSILKAIRENSAKLVITTGGTGLSPRDVTPESIQEICDRVIPGVGECLRSTGANQTQMAWLGRPLGALVGKTMVIALPGSLKAVREGLEALREFLPHGLHIVDGGNHDQLR